MDPAPAAAAPAGAPAGTAKVVPALPPLPIRPPTPVEKPVGEKPVRATTKRTEAKKTETKPAPPRARPVPPPVAPAPGEAAASATETPAGVATGAPGAAGDSPGGTADGVAGGRVGGTGVARLGDVATAPVLVTRVVPEYPRRARLAGIEGEVVLEVIVDRHGRVASDPTVVRAVPELERAAVAAVRQWRFRPARDPAGAAVAVLMEVPVRFVLHEATADASR